MRVLSGTCYLWDRNDFGLLPYFRDSVIVKRQFKMGHHASDISGEQYLYKQEGRPSGLVEFFLLIFLNVDWTTRGSLSTPTGGKTSGSQPMFL